MTASNVHREVESKDPKNYGKAEEREEKHIPILGASCCKMHPSKPGVISDESLFRGWKTLNGQLKHRRTDQYSTSVYW